MRIVADLQALQASNARRGIGRYSANLVRAMADNIGAHELVGVLNGTFANSESTLATALGSSVGAINCRIWYGPEAVGANEASCPWRRRAAEQIREAFLAQLNPDIIHVASLFEGFDSDAVTSVGSFTMNKPTAVTHYDLIPLMHRDIYLRHASLATWYDGKVDHLRRASAFLAISESSRRELIDNLGLPDHTVTNISGAADAYFTRLPADQLERERVCRTYGIDRGIVLYTGGIDHRKNISGLISAFAQLDATLQQKHQLVIVCAATPQQREQLAADANRSGLRKQDFVLTGYVPDSDLRTLYNICSLFVFPSWHEGFGLPVLEAMQCGAPVIGSNNSSVAEIIGNVRATFDPKSSRDIAAKMTEVLRDDGFRYALIEHGSAQARSFSWANTAKRCIGALEQAARLRIPMPSVARDRRPSLAYVSPLPPQRSGISDYSSELLPGLSPHYDITAIVEQDAISCPFVQANCEVKSASWMHRNASRFDRILYHVGNSHFHHYMFELMAAHPGVVCLHDFFLSGALFDAEMRAPATQAWSRALYRSHGFPALHQRFSKDAMAVMETYPVNFDVLAQSVGVIVHSHFAKALANRWYSEDWDQHIQVAPMVRPVARSYDRAAARRMLGLPDDQFVVCSFGIIAPSKLNHRVLEAWLASEVSKLGNAHLVFVGDDYNSGYGAGLRQTMRKSHAASRIRVTKFVDPECYSAWLAAADVGVQLRTSSRGETSRATLDCMSYGLPVIANRHGSSAEQWPILPLPDAFTSSDLVRAFDALWKHASVRKHLGMSARRAVLSRHQPDQVGRRFMQLVESFYEQQQNGEKALIRRLGAMIASSDGRLSPLQLAPVVAQNFRDMRPATQLLIDLSDTAWQTAIDELRASLSCLLASASPFRVELISFRDGQYVYERRRALGVLGIDAAVLDDAPVDIASGDFILALGPASSCDDGRQHALQRWQRHGCRLYWGSDLSSQKRLLRAVAQCGPELEKRVAALLAVAAPITNLE